VVIIANACLVSASTLWSLTHPQTTGLLESGVRALPHAVEELKLGTCVTSLALRLSLTRRFDVIALCNAAVQAVRCFPTLSALNLETYVERVLLLRF
jgi:hypothetical protein